MHLIVTFKKKCGLQYRQNRAAMPEVKDIVLMGLVVILFIAVVYLTWKNHKPKMEPKGADCSKTRRASREEIKNPNPEALP